MILRRSSGISILDLKRWHFVAAASLSSIIPGRAVAGTRRLVSTTLWSASLVCLGTGNANADARSPDAPIRVLIVDGQNNHDWVNTTPALRNLLENTGNFTVRISTTPWAPPIPNLRPGAPDAEKISFEARVKDRSDWLEKRKTQREHEWAQWNPDFFSSDVILLNYNGEDWPRSACVEFERFVRNGGGLVLFHAANNSFPTWKEFNEMSGLGGWRGRGEQSGAYLRKQNGHWRPVDTPGLAGGHSPKTEFKVTIETWNAITEGLPADWIHSSDELYHSLRGPANHVTVLLSAWSEQSRELEPVVFVVQYGQGRVFHCTLGHDMIALRDGWLRLLLLRGTEWAATGKVRFTAALKSLPAEIKNN